MTYAIKIFDDLNQAGQLHVMRSIPSTLGLEIAIYRKSTFIPEISQLIKTWPSPVIMHISHKENSLEYQNPEYWNQEIKLAANHGVFDFVLHISPSGRKTDLSPDQAQKMANLLCLKYPHFKFYFENTYEDLAWWIEFFDKELHPHVGFTFDLGHTRALVPSCLEDWLVLLRKLNMNGRPLHFHLHANPGDADRHEPLYVGDYMGWYQPDTWLLRPIDYYLQEFNKMRGLKTLESKVKYTQGNLLWLQHKNLIKPSI